MPTEHDLEFNKLIFDKISDNLISSGITLVEQGHDYVEVLTPDGNITDCVIIIDHGNCLIENCRTLPSKFAKISLASPTAFEEITATVLSIYK